MMMGEGSGFFVSADGYIVTNNHVVQNAKTVTVTMDDGKTLDAKVIGTDPKTDLALIKVDEAGDYPFVTLAKEKPRIGDWVVAIGNPYGLGGTVTAGIISAEGRDIGDGPYDRFLQIDAPINNGNSGGPTFNMKGEVVGVNTAIFSPSGGSVGIGFAIPASTVDSVVGFARAWRRRRARLSRRQDPAGHPGDRREPGAEDRQGRDRRRGDAGNAGRRSRPQGGRRHHQAERPGGQGRVRSHPPHRLAQARRQGRADLSARRRREDGLDHARRPEERDRGQGRRLAGEGAGRARHPDRSAPRTATRASPIVGVDPNGSAAEQGLAEGDVILDVAGKPVSSPADVKAGIANAKSQGKKSVMMRIQTADGSASLRGRSVPQGVTESTPRRDGRRRALLGGKRAAVSIQQQQSGSPFQNPLSTPGRKPRCRRF